MRGSERNRRLIASLLVQAAPVAIRGAARAELQRIAVARVDALIGELAQAGADLMRVTPDTPKPRKTRAKSETTPSPAKSKEKKQAGPAGDGGKP